MRRSAPPHLEQLDAVCPGEYAFEAYARFGGAGYPDLLKANRSCLKSAPSRAGTGRLVAARQRWCTDIRADLSLPLSERRAPGLGWSRSPLARRPW